MDSGDLDKVASIADIIQIGAQNIQNLVLLNTGMNLDFEIDSITSLDRFRLSPKNQFILQISNAQNSKILYFSGRKLPKVESREQVSYCVVEFASATQFSRNLAAGQEYTALCKYISVQHKQGV